MESSTEGSIEPGSTHTCVDNQEGATGAVSKLSGDNLQVDRTDDKPETLSKSQLKKIKKKEKWNQVKAEKR